MSIDLIVDGRIHKAKHFLFSGGEVQLELPPFDSYSKIVNVVSRVQSSEDLMQLILTSEIIHRVSPGSFKRLILPYFPYARQDRVMKTFESFSLKAFAKTINNLKFDSVVTYDTHSSVTDALVERIHVVPQYEIIKQYSGLQDFIKSAQPVLIAPDAGAVKKAGMVAKQTGLPLVVAHKARDVQNGNVKIAGVSEIELLADSDCLILDDICDGGATFTLLAKYLREHIGVKKIGLYVTHGIFSKGYEVFRDLVDVIYTTDTFIPKEHPLATEIPVFVHPIKYEGFDASPNS